MSGYEEHFSVGLIVTFVAGLIAWMFGWLAYTNVNVLTLVGISFVFSLLPDIDIGTSMIRRVAVGGFIVFLLINGLTMWGYVFAIALFLVQFLHHRGIMHTYIMGILLAGVLYFFCNDWVFPIIALLNFVSHLWLDSL